MQSSSKVQNKKIELNTSVKQDEELGNKASRESEIYFAATKNEQPNIIKLEQPQNSHAASRERGYTISSPISYSRSVPIKPNLNRSSMHVGSLALQLQNIQIAAQSFKEKIQSFCSITIVDNEEWLNIEKDQLSIEQFNHLINFLKSKECTITGLNLSRLKDLLTIDPNRKQSRLIRIYEALNFRKQSKFNPLITKLNIAGCDLEEIGNLSLIDDLTYLDIGCNKLDSKELERICKSMKNLSYLGISGYIIGPKEAKIISTNMKNLTRLDISNSNIGDKEIKHICNIKNLVYLNVSNNKITSKGAETLAKSSSMSILRELHVNKNNITFEGIKLLTDNLGLNKLNVIDNDLNENDFKKLSELNLEFCTITFQ